MNKENIVAMVRPLSMVFGCCVPPILNFGQGSLWHLILVPWFIYSVIDWACWYRKQKKVQE